MSFKIYTKTGDAGQTSLIGGTRVPKNHIRIEAYGTVDELNSWLGVISDAIKTLDKYDELKYIQDKLFVLGSELACDPGKEVKMNLPELKIEDIARLEASIDHMESTLPMLKNFVLPGGHPIASQLHIARCVCRRAERICVGMQEMNEPIDTLLLQYLNRLSDYLFVLSRYVLHQLHGEERIWKGV